MGTKRFFHEKTIDKRCSDIYKRIERLIQKRGFSVYLFSKRIGIPESTIHNWKYGTSIPSVKHLISVADFFGVTLDYLCGRG